MEFVYLRLHELEKFAEENFSDKKSTIAITPWRAASQVKNPFAREDDVLMIVAKDKTGKIVGYIGILPFILRGNTEIPIYYTTCWRAEPCAEKGTGNQLLKRFLQYTNNNVLFSDQEERTAGIIARAGDFHVGYRNGVLLRFRYALHTRTRYLKKNGVKMLLIHILHISGILKIFDFVLNLFYDRNIKKYLNDEIQPVSNLNVNNSVSTCSSKTLSIIHAEPDEDTYQFILEHTPANAVTLVNARLVDWWKNSNWLIQQRPEIRDVNERYYFSSFANDFHYDWISVFEDESRIGLACLSFRDGIVKTLYLWYKEDCSETFFNALIREILQDKNNHTLISFHEKFVEFLLKMNIPAISRLEKKRYTAIPKKYFKFDYLMQDGDGDYGRT